MKFLSETKEKETYEVQCEGYEFMQRKEDLY